MLIHLLCIIIILGSGLFLIGRFSTKEDPTERKDGKVIHLDDYEEKLRGDYPPVRKVQEN